MILKQNYNRVLLQTFLLIFALINLCPIEVISQNCIKGLVQNKQNEPVPFASIILTDSANIIIKATITNDAGRFSITNVVKGDYLIIVSNIGYKKNSKRIFINNDIELLTILEEDIVNINEVIFYADGSTIVKKDTINFKVKYFTDGSEQTVEDLLKKIPGLKIDSDGSIKVGNQEIDKLLIDGDDLFNKGYKILSKNMPAYSIEEVEVLQRFSNNQLLKGIEESDKVALNLKINEKVKHLWFGNVDASWGIQNFHQIKGNAMKFQKKSKYYFFANYNNIGYDATDDIEHLVHPIILNKQENIGDQQNATAIIKLNADNLDFKRSRVNINDARLGSLNVIFNPLNKLKIKALCFYNLDKTSFFKNSSESVDVDSISFINKEQYELDNSNRVAFFKLDIDYNILKSQKIETTTKYNNGDSYNLSDIIFNSNFTSENLKSKNILFDQNVTYTNKINNKNALIINGRFINEKTPQNYIVNKDFFEDIFSNYSSVNNVKQVINNQMDFAGLSAHWLNRKMNNDLLELHIGNEYRNDNLLTAFSLLENDIIINKPNGYQNHTEYSKNDLYLKGKFNYNIKKIVLIGELGVHQLFNRLTNNFDSNSQKLTFINPGIGINWNIDKKNKINASYSFNKTTASVIDVNSDYILTGFRSFSKGLGSFSQLDESSFFLKYQMGDWSSRFFVNTLILFSKNHDYITTNSKITQNYTQFEKTLVKNRTFLSFYSQFDYYLKFLSSNLKIDVELFRSEFKNIINDLYYRNVVSENYTYGIEMRSGFKSFFNYHTGIKWTTYRIETTIDYSYTNVISFLDLFFSFREKLNFQLQAERYFFGNLDAENIYYFFDFNICYILKSNKLNMRLIGKNILNINKYKAFSINDIGTSEKTYRLLPRIFLLNIEYRF